MENLGFYRVAAAVPQVHAAEVDFNCREIIRLAEIAETEEAAAVVFPELSLSGASCGDIYGHDRLLNAVKGALCQVADAFSESKMIIVLGLPWLHNTGIFNAAAVIQSGKILGLSVKQHLNAVESRIFSDGALLPEAEEVEFFGYSTYIGGNMLFKAGKDFTFAVELGSDVDNLAAPGRFASGAGATVVFNLDSAPLLAGNDEKRCNKFAVISGQLEVAYVVANAGVTESTTYNVHGGCSLIADCGRIDAVSAGVADLTAREQFGDGEILYADIDLEALNFRRRNRCGKANGNLEVVTFELECIPAETVTQLKYAHLSSSPFLPENEDEWPDFCREIVEIQSAALARRINFTHAEKLVLGISGGLDSTLALLVCCESMKLLKRPCSDIMAITMPGFGTSDRTYNNAMKMCSILQVELRDIKIADACLQHFAAIGHDAEAMDVTYENAQARERTQILMDLANQHNGLVVGTGDLSEIALGWSTFNGDHMAMYGVNANVPKSLIRIIVDLYGRRHSEALYQVLNDIVLTPVSPELLPVNADGKIDQHTEKIVGAYDLHDFFLYHFIRNGASPEKVIFMAREVFAGEYESREIERTAAIFFKRFFSQQFKRNCAPDGPQVLEINISSHGGWEMPSDVYGTLFNLNLV